MVAVNPFAEFRVQCETALREALSSLFPEVSLASVTLEAPPSPEFGELASSLCFELAKQTKKKPLDMAKRLANRINKSRFPLVQLTKAAGEGYVNFYADFAKFSSLTIESVRVLDTEYGFVKVEKPAKTIVEHTSANPLRPLNIATARNTMLGDSIARVLRARGHVVSRHYYVDDMGRQSAVVAYGYEKLGKPQPEGKPDHFFGIIYAVTSCIVEIRRLKREVERAREHATAEEASKLQRELDEWVSVAVDLESRYPRLFSLLTDAIRKDEDPEARIGELNRGYEAGELKAKQLIREVSQLCVEAFKQTLGRLGVFFDSWDWESDYVWNSDVKHVLDELEKTPYVFRAGEVWEFDANKVAQNLDLKKEFKIREDYDIPSLTLVRADGTTLYTTRDIPYSLWKFQRAERVINVIGMDQPLAQLQLKLALCALGHVDYARNLTHFAYNLVRLPDYRMSSRTGRYISLDDVIDEAVKRAYEEVSKRSPHLPEEEKNKISTLVGIGALKYALVGVDPSKPVVFTWDRVLDFEKNSAPYIQYTHARACSILKKAERKPEKPDFALLKETLERDIILRLAEFPDTFIDSADNLQPNAVADFANLLADEFNTFYNALPVIKAKPNGLSDARLALVEATKIVLRNALNLLGIEAPERM